MIMIQRPGNMNSFRQTMETLNELLQTASKVPFTNNCMIERDRAIRLIQSAIADLPAVITECENVVLNQNRIIQEAEDCARAIQQEATARATKYYNETHTKATQLMNAANTKAGETVTAANQQAQNTVATAQKQAEDIVENAKDSAKVPGDWQEIEQFLTDY